MLTLFFGYLLVVLILAALPRVAIRNPFFQKFKALLPSWRFFEDFDDPVRLHYRVRLPSGWNEWTPVLPRLRRRWYGLIFNPEGNLALASQSLVQQLVEEVSELPENGSESAHDAVASLQSFRLVKNLVFFMCKQALDPSTSELQFKISGSSEDYLISPPYPVAQESLTP